MNVPAKDQFVAVVGAIRDTLLTITEVTEIVGDAIHLEDIDDSQSLPYIIFYHITGGYESKTQTHAVDTYYKIVGVTTNKSEALSLFNAIGKLHYMDLVTTNEPDMQAYGGIQRQTDIWENNVVQQVTHYHVGGIFRFRFIMNCS